jgi:hypothetical protein
MTEQNPENTPETPETPPAPPTPEEQHDEALARLADARKAAARKSREDYDKATAPTREAEGYVARYAAYDDVRLAFIEGTVADDSAGAKAAAKALGHEGSHITTRKV